MNRIDEINKRIKYKKNPKETTKKCNYFILKFFIVFLLFVFMSLLVNNDIKIKNIIYSKVYNNNFSFAQFKNIYNKYIGNIIPFQNIFKSKQVFNEKLEYISSSKHNKGLKLTLKDGYAIPTIKGGIVTFVGNKKDLGKTVIINQTDGIDVWYSNLSNTNLKLYDYVEDNSIVGEAKNNTLYLTFQKNGVEIEYKDILK